MHKLFQPYKIGKLEVKNRFVRSATEDWLGDADGSISADKIALYDKLAAGGVGTIITGHAYVSHPHGRAGLRQNAICDDKFIDGFSRLAEKVHEHGAKLILQLAHAGRQTAPEIIDGQMPVAPADLFDEKGGQTACAISRDEMRRLVEEYGAAALRAKQAGLDGVQIHMAHGYLMAQFLSPFTNKRDDEYGGDADHRIRFPAEVISGVRDAVGAAFPVMVKLNSTDGLPASVQPQLVLEDVVKFAKVLRTHSVDAIEVSGGTIKENRLVMSKPGIKEPADEAYFAPAAAAIKANVDIPVILVGGLRSLAVMQAVIDNDQADMVSMSRTFIREPQLIRQFMNGQLKATCISCNGCFNPEGIRCVLE